MSKVFGYPAFNRNGERMLTTYDNAYKEMLMDIRVYRMKGGEVKTFQKSGEETAVLLLFGHIVFHWEGNSREAGRRDVFTEGPWCLHVPRKTEFRVAALSDAEILVQSTHNAASFKSRIYGPQDAPWDYACKGMFGNVANRRVNTIFDYDRAPYSNMVLGEVLNDRGNWSGYVPHSHPQPEVYYFLFDRPEGFGASFVGEAVYKIKDGSFAAIPGGKTHPQAAAPGYQMYTCWMIRHLPNDPWRYRIDDERYVWLNHAQF